MDSTVNSSAINSPEKTEFSCSYLKTLEKFLCRYVFISGAVV